MQIIKQSQYFSVYLFPLILFKLIMQNAKIFKYKPFSLFIILSVITFYVHIFKSLMAFLILKKTSKVKAINLEVY